MLWKHLGLVVLLACSVSATTYSDQQLSHSNKVQADESSKDLEAGSKINLNDATSDQNSKAPEVNELVSGSAESSTGEEDGESYTVTKTLKLISEDDNTGVVDHEDKRRLDMIGNSGAFHGFGKRRLDSINRNSAFDSFGKRQLDTINENNAFLGFGKRRLDTINGNSAFQGFGKRRLDSINGNRAFQGFEKRRLDSINGNSAFQGFGKRRLDSINGNSAFQGFGKRRLDSINGNSAFQGFGKRRLDSINGNSAFQGFGKRRLDSINRNSAFQGFGKRRLDSINGNSAFQGFGKRRLDSINGNSAFQGFGKRRLDSINGNSAFQGFGKRRLDSINGNSAFQGFGKRRLDSINGNSAFQGFGKRRLDSINGNSAFQGFGKRRLDTINGNRAFQGFGKRGTDNDDIEGQKNIESRKKRSAEKPEDHENQHFPVAKRSVSEGDITMSLLKTSEDTLENSAVKRRFDAISAGFRQFGKRQPYFSNENNFKTDFASVGDENEDDLRDIRKRRFDRISNGVHGFGSFGKRRLDTIGHTSAFGSSGFGKRRFDSLSSSSSFLKPFSKRRLDRISSGNRFRSFGKRRLDRISGRSSPFWKFGKRDAQQDQQEHHKRTFDRISASNSFRGFGKRDLNLIDYLTPNLGLYPSSLPSSSSMSSFPRPGEPGLRRSQVSYPSFHHLKSPIPNGQFSETTSVDKRRFDSIDSFNLFRRFGRGANTESRISSTREAALLQSLLDVEYPHLVKALEADQSNVSDTDFQLALLELIDLVADDTDSK